jgi:hypothetical protein
MSKLGLAKLDLMGQWYTSHDKFRINMFQNQICFKYVTASILKLVNPRKIKKRLAITI